LAFENGIVVEGRLVSQTFIEDKLVLLSFADCKVTDNEGQVFFEPAWGMFDMAIGDNIVSVFNGSADKNALEDQLYVSEQPTHQPNYTAKDLQYQSLFKQIRTYREQGKSDDSLNEIWQQIKNNFETDWLGAMELLELADTMPNQQALANELRTYLHAQSNRYPAYSKLIRDGLKIIDTKLKFE
jgi:phenylalanine-4-hydroxylase